MKGILLICFSLNLPVVFAQWVPLNSSTTSYLPQIFFLNNDTGFVNQEEGILRRSLNGGNTWSIVYNGGAPEIYHFTFTSFLNGNATGYHTISQTNDGGAHWTARYTDNGNVIFNSICFPTPNVGFVTAWSPSSDSSIVFKTIDGGNSWALAYGIQMFSTHFGCSFFINKDTGFIGMENSLMIAKTTDGGLNWNYNTLSTSLSNINGIHFLASGIGYACGMSGEIFKSIDFGNSWSDITDLGNSYPLYSIFFVNPDTGFTVGGDGFSTGLILQTDNGGVSWDYTVIPSRTYNSVYFPSETRGYTCGIGGSIRRYDQLVGFPDAEKSRGNLYPNPSTGILHIRTHSAINYKIISSVGDLISSGDLSPTQSIINLSVYPKGIYFVKISQGDKVSTQKIILM
jgi:photosystem II stability/assembly factor-like uncharacterized protein